MYVLQFLQVMSITGITEQLQFSRCRPDIINKTERFNFKSWYIYDLGHRVFKRTLACGVVVTMWLKTILSTVKKFYC